MFRKLFGETEQDQIQFLHPRAIATLVILALMVVALIQDEDHAGNVPDGEAEYSE